MKTYDIQEPRFTCFASAWLSMFVTKHPIVGSRLRWWVGIFLLLPFPISAPAQPDPCSLGWQLTSSDSPFGDFHTWYLTGQASAYDSRRHVPVVFGGLLVDPNGQNVPFDSGTWEWNGTQWEGPLHFVEPPPRSDAAMAYDDARGVCVLFGGHLNNLAFNDTYEWDGSKWIFRQAFDPTATDRPPPTAHPVMAYDSARRRTVLENVSGMTWEWDGASWSSQPTAPPSRIHAAMVYDPIRHVTVLFGGQSDVPPYNFLNDTQTWDGRNWTQVSTGGPAPRYDHAMAYDLHRKVIVLFGGTASDVIDDQLGDTWEWDGQSWSPQLDAGRFGLGPREGSTMWYDAVQQRLMVFGGGRYLPVGGGVYKGNFPNDVWEARPPGYWVDFNAPGLPGFPETGYFNEPFNTLAEAVTSANAGCTLNLKAGSRAETITISKPLTLEAFFGPATIGQ